MNTVDMTSNLIAYFEGYASTAYFDVNAFRLGYGSDTEGPEQIRVTKGMTTTRERALANLKLRVPDFLDTVRKQIGEDLYVKLGPATLAALGSIAYNYGSLPDSIVRAVTNNPATVSAEIRARASDNAGVNRRRRYGEAACAALDGGEI